MLFFVCRCDRTHQSIVHSVDLFISTHVHWLGAANFSETSYVEASWNVMAHAQKPYFVFRRNGRVHLNRRGRQFTRLLEAEVCASAVVVVVVVVVEALKGTGYPLHLPVSPSLSLPCVILCHHISPGVYQSTPFRRQWSLYLLAWERYLPPLAPFSCSWTMVLWSSLMMSWWSSCCMSATDWHSCIFGAVSIVFVTCTLAGWNGVIIHTPRSSICLCFQSFSTDD
jgi:hypothetical protein